MKISAFIPVYNEEKRIFCTLKNLSWCDEILILDKESTDKTLEIAREFDVLIHQIKNSDAYSAEEFEIISKCSGDWVIIFTASDIIDVELAMDIRKTIATIDPKFSVVSVPYERYILGINSSKSPWSQNTHTPIIFKRNEIKIDKQGVHGAFIYSKDAVYKLVSKGTIRHLTHESVDDLLNRHIRYWRGERNNFNGKTLAKPIRNILKSMTVVLRKGTFFLGMNGLVLIIAYITYFLFSFLYKWEKLKSRSISKEYELLKDKSIHDWEGYSRLK